MFTQIVVFMIAYTFMYIIFKILDSKYKFDGAYSCSDILGKWQYILVFFMTVFYQVTILVLIVLCTVITYNRYKVLADAKKWS